MDKLHILSNLWDANLDSVDVATLSRRLNESHRGSVLKWLVESLDLLKIDDRVFFATAILADQFAVSRPISSPALEASELQLVILASLCCSLKTVDCLLDASIRDFLDHVSGGHVEPKTIFEKEALILETLNWNVITQSPSVYIESFYYALLCDKEVESLVLEQATKSSALPEWAEKQFFFSQFLLYLSVFQINWFHNQKPSVLVSACILTSMYVIPDYEDRYTLSQIGSLLRNCGWITNNDIYDLIHSTIANWEKALSDPSISSILTLFSTPKKMHVSHIRPPRRLLSSGA